MKKLSLILTFLFISTITYGQTTFNNGDGDNKWSTAANWTNGIPNAANAKAKIAAASVIVDGDYTVGQIIFVNAAAGGQKVITFTNANNGTLTITGKGVSQPVQLNRNPQHAIFNLPVIFDSSENKTETWRFNSGNEKITFGEGHSLTVNDEMVFTAKTNTSSIIFNGTNTGVGNLKFGTASNVKFGSTYDGSSYSGTMIVAGDNTTTAKVTLTSDVADAGTFLKSGASISVVKNGGTINVNGKNTLKGDISLTSAFKVALNINKNQSTIGTITMGSGTLNLALATDVTSAAFADNSSSDWGTGSLVITGAGDQEVSFGTTANGITADQLAQITLNGSTPLINSTGKLIGSSIAVSTFNNAGGDNLWSNAANWSAGIPNDDTAKVTVDSDLIVDSSVTVGQIKMSGATSDASVTITATNSSVLTITGAGVTQPIQNNKKASSFIFNLPVVFDSDGETETLKLNSGGDQQITFSSSLTLNDPLTVTGVNKLHDLNLNGSLLGAGNLILGAKAQANFGADYDGSSHTGKIIVAGTGTNNDNLITSNVSDDGTLLASGNQIDVQGAGAKIIINGANTLKGNIKIGDNDPTLTINKNQSTLGTITMGAGTLNLVVATDVTSAAFADNSLADWGTGSLVITGAADNEVSFGTTAAGITAAQLAQITMDVYSAPNILISSSGQISVKADIDEDGILNNEDECPDTPKGTVVNYKGCPTFVLPENNNKVEITSATCIGYSDGSIGLSVVDTSYDYTITITGNTDVLLTGSNNKASVTGLAKGTYTVCFKVDGEPEYEQCFDVLIEEPERISVYMDVDIDNKTSSFQLSGSNIYNIDVNGTLHKVNKDSFTTSLPAGLSIIKIYTDLDCQGIIEKEVFISEDIMYYPNPTINDVNVHISGMDKKVMISVFSEKGDLVLRKEQQVQDLSRLTEIDLSLQNTGTYIVVMEGKTVRKTFKIIKK